MEEAYYLDEITQRKEQKYFILIIYDIVDNKRRYRLVKYLESFGFRVQKSAFEARLNKETYRRLVHGIPRFAQHNDSIRIYRMSGEGQVLKWGVDQSRKEEEVIII